MKRVRIGLLLITLLLTLFGCTPSESTFTIEKYNLQLTADSSFRDSTQGDYDLQITNGNCYIGVMVYNYADLEIDTTPQDIYNWQNEDIFSRRENVTVLEEAQTRSFPGRTVTCTLYSAEKSGNENYYASYLIDFPEKETFAWVLVSMLPSYHLINGNNLDNIVTSLSPIS